ncbi:MAG: GTP 3',8-cyclase MoaA [Thermoprotei archaeon]|nr:MAG: GTP 3',8-cyclase MoaA [Thermoprotei archaeon]
MTAKRLTGQCFKTVKWIRGAVLINAVMLVDAYGRPLTHVRITVTHKCNYSCFFCHREGEAEGHDLLTPEGLARFAEAAVRLGIRYFKLTGGEPLLRADLEEIIAALKLQRGIEVSLVTNGYFLRERLKTLLQAGLDRVNVSLNSLSPNTYLRITGVNGLKRVLETLSLCRDYGLPTKLNVVVLKDLNEHEIPDIIGFASNMGFDVNLIELIPLGVSWALYSKYHVDLKHVERMLIAMGAERRTREFQRRPTYVLPTGVRVEIVRGYGNPELCKGCSRVRLTHDGKLKPCLYRLDGLVDIAPFLKPDLPRRMAVTRMEEALREVNKRRRPFFT